MLQYALMWLIRQRRDYGYSLKRRFEERMGGAWLLNIGQVYQTLQKLERAGMVVLVAGEGQEQYPARRLFELTTKGQRALDRWLQRPPARPRPLRDESLIRLLVLEAGRYADAVAQISELEQLCRKHLTRLSAQRSRLDGEQDGALLVRHLGLQAELLHAEAHLRWLDYCRQRLEQGTAAASAG
jgi:DNA-binding PadR family transcriptional regulator